MFIVQMHSMIDVITNSSTELFVCDTDKSITLVRELLVDMIEVYNKATGQALAFERVFEEPRKYTSADRELLRGWTFTPSEGSLVIEGFQDNSIPWGLQQLIEDAFNADRFHLG